MNYQLIGIDLDGTLLNEEGRVSDANAAALRRANDAGLHVVPCTGRAWHESYEALKGLDFLTQGVFVTGAAVNEVATGQAVDMAMVEPHLAAELIEPLHQIEQPILVFRDRALAGHDYLVASHHEPSDNTRWWFDHTRSRVRYTPEPTLEDLHHVLRVGMVARGAHVAELTQRLQHTYRDKAIIHHFTAIHMPDEARSLHVLEMFAMGVDKWRGLTWLADQHGIPHDRIAAIGDSINDISMLTHAACGIAMGNASDPARAAADQHTKPNTEDGLAYAIDQLLDGKW